jgi:YHS domain-containing protein
LATPTAQLPPTTIAAATEPSPEPVPAKTIEVPLALDGYCPVALSVGEKWIAGNPAFYTMYHGQVFRFSTEEAMKKFMEEPMKYAPAAMGEDVVLMTDRGKRVYGSRKFGAWYKDRMFLFSTQESLETFAAKPEYYRDIALKYETAMKGGNTRF